MTCKCTALSCPISSERNLFKLFKFPKNQQLRIIWNKCIQETNNDDHLGKEKYFCEVFFCYQLMFKWMLQIRFFIWILFQYFYLMNSFPMFLVAFWWTLMKGFQSKIFEIICNSKYLFSISSKRLCKKCMLCFAVCLSRWRFFFKNFTCIRSRILHWKRNWKRNAEILEQLGIRLVQFGLQKARTQRKEKLLHIIAEKNKMYKAKLKNLDSLNN